ncbi:MAG: PQQ-dependent sugar dehydrogenase [Planctomycetota bacterium]
MQTFTRVLGLCALLSLALAAPAAAQNVPDDFSVENVVTSGVSQPTDMAFLPDGRAIIAQYNGGLRLWRPTVGTTATIIGTVSGPSIETGSERGMLSIAVDPDFINNGFIYTWSARLTSSSMWLCRHTLSGDLNNATSSNLTLGQQFILFNDAPDNAFNHNGGTVRFGPDGMLYLSIGDDAVQCSAQNRTILAGGLYRMDMSQLPATGTGPANKADLNPGDNPFSTSANLNEALLIAWGLRNPFSFNVDPVTGDMFIADVGQNAREELDWFPRNLGGTITALNYGWPLREGIAGFSSCPGVATTGLTNPIDDYSQSSGGFSIMSAGVYRNLGQANDWGMDYEFNVFHNDYFNGTIERLEFDGTSWSNAPSVSGQPSAAYWGTGFANCVHFELGPDGSMYFCNRTANRISRIKTDGPVNGIVVISGDDQVGVSEETFKHPVVIEVQTPSGTPIPGAQVTLSVVGGTLAGSAVVTADAQGRASVMISATNPGSVTLTAITPGGSAGGTQVVLFARGIGVNHIRFAGSHDLVIASFVNTSNGTAPVPILFAMTDDSVPTIPTAFGLLTVDLLSMVSTIVIEDPEGLFNGSNIQGGFGTPSNTNVYNLIPLGLLFGQLRFQAIFRDATTPTSVLGRIDSELALSNTVIIDFD